MIIPIKLSFWWFIKRLRMCFQSKFTTDSNNQMGLSRVKDICREIFELCNISLHFCLLLWVTHNQQSQEAIWEERRKRQAHQVHDGLFFLGWIFNSNGILSLIPNHYIIYKMNYIQMPCPFTGLKMFCAGPNILSQPKKLCAGTKTNFTECKSPFCLAQNVSDCHNM